jgi:hypothetical protein
METYSYAELFIIKSYSENDVHKSIKYNVGLEEDSRFALSLTNTFSTVFVDESQ